MQTLLEETTENSERWGGYGHLAPPATIYWQGTRASAGNVTRTKTPEAVTRNYFNPDGYSSCVVCTYSDRGAHQTIWITSTPIKYIIL